MDQLQPASGVNEDSFRDSMRSPTMLSKSLEPVRATKVNLYRYAGLLSRQNIPSQLAFHRPPRAAATHGLSRTIAVGIRRRLLLA